MSIYNIHVQDFEGPLDLLIHLIEKDKIDIYDIPIVSVTEQYITYINNMKEYSIEVASDFLLMAAALLQIKSKMLLPKSIVEDEEEADPRQMLVEMLVEYRRVKKHAEMLRGKLALASLCVARDPMPMPHFRRKLKPMMLNDLLLALAGLVAEDDITPQIIARQEFHVQDKMSDIISLLHCNNKAVAFSKALDNVGNRSEKIATFLAVLELLRLKKINIRQKEAFAPIYLFLREE
ncbi:MAG: segregation/condensation protein A [Acidaminococcaceae bacterium]|nr:segregation/condensation protein A [Acidaminococcaceae bacterium]MDD4722751.1 segregation/condensation protein A [Acidaminococcaceae bacterium]